MRKNRILRKLWLEQAGACSDTVKRFNTTFGYHTRVTQKICLKHSNEFDWEWAAEHFLSDKGRRNYQGLTKKARDKYYSFVFLPDGACSDRVDRALATFNFDRVLAKAFCTAYNTDPAPVRYISRL